jgi:hypothetical protein
MREPFDVAFKVNFRQLYVKAHQQSKLVSDARKVGFNAGRMLTVLNSLAPSFMATPTPSIHQGLQLPRKHHMLV